MNNCMFVHIITTLSDEEAIKIHDRQFELKVTEEIRSVNLHTDFVNAPNNSRDLIDLLRKARRNNLRCILHVDDFDIVSSFPVEIKTAILNNCVFIGDNGIEDGTKILNNSSISNQTTQERYIGVNNELLQELIRTETAYMNALVKYRLSQDDNVYDIITKLYTFSEYYRPLLSSCITDFAILGSVNAIRIMEEKSDTEGFSKVCNQLLNALVQN